jgi:hypothetical protein
MRHGGRFRAYQYILQSGQTKRPQQALRDEDEFERLNERCAEEVKI